MSKETISTTDYYNNPGTKFGETPAMETPAEAVVETRVEPAVTETVVQKVDNTREVNALKQAAKVEPAAPAEVKLETPEATAAEQTSSNPDGSYDIDIRDDSPLTEAEIDEIVNIAEERGLTKEQTQKLISSKEAVYSRGVESKMAEARQTLAKMEAEVKKDPHFANSEVYAESFSLIDAAIDKFGSPALKTKARDYLSRDIEVLKFLRNIGSIIAEDAVRGKNTISVVETDSHTASLKQQYPEHF